jgi:hypothetical protein
VVSGIVEARRAFGAWVTNGDPYLRWTASAVTTANNATSFSGSGPSGGFTVRNNGAPVVSVFVQIPSSWNITGEHGYLNGTTFSVNGVSQRINGLSW